MRGVCLAPDQFSCWLPGPDRDAMLAADWLTPEFAAALAIGDALAYPQAGLPSIPSLVGNATHYYAASMPTPPSWAASMVFVREIGDQRFYAIPDAAV